MRRVRELTRFSDRPSTNNLKFYFDRLTPLQVNQGKLQPFQSSWLWFIKQVDFRTNHIPSLVSQEWKDGYTGTSRIFNPKVNEKKRKTIRFFMVWTLKESKPKMPEIWWGYEWYITYYLDTYVWERLNTCCGSPLWIRYVIGSSSRSVAYRNTEIESENMDGIYFISLNRLKSNPPTPPAFTLPRPSENQLIRSTRPPSIRFTSWIRATYAWVSGFQVFLHSVKDSSTVWWKKRIMQNVLNSTTAGSLVSMA